MRSPLCAQVKEARRLDRRAQYDLALRDAAKAAFAACDVAWAALAARLPFAPGRLHAYTPNETGSYGGGTHLGLPCDLVAGRLRRAFGDALCKPHRQFHNPEWTGPLEHIPNCLRCLDLAARLTAGPLTLTWNPALAAVAAPIEALADVPLRHVARSWLAALHRLFEWHFRVTPTVPFEVTHAGEALQITWPVVACHAVFTFAPAGATWSVALEPDAAPHAQGPLDLLCQGSWDGLGRLARSALLPAAPPATWAWIVEGAARST